ncbi:MAG: hypothetical protein IJA69_02305 [Clostridia bacterium]|nr:hypothetical protein [Clostridia bacterium]
MEKSAGMNYKTKRILMTISLIIKCLFAVLMVVFFCLYKKYLDYIRIFFEIILISMGIEDQELLTKQVDSLMDSIFIIFALVVVVLFAIIAYNFYRLLMNKKRFYAGNKKYALFQFVNTITLPVAPISSILMIVASFCEDDGKECKTRIKKPKEKKQKPKLPKQVRQEISMLKKQKRRGIISQELFDKKVKKIKKNNDTNV